MSNTNLASTQGRDRKKSLFSKVFSFKKRHSGSSTTQQQSDEPRRASEEDVMGTSDIAAWFTNQHPQQGGEDDSRRNRKENNARRMTQQREASLGSELGTSNHQIGCDQKKLCAAMADSPDITVWYQKCNDSGNSSTRSSDHARRNS